MKNAFLILSVILFSGTGIFFVIEETRLVPHSIFSQKVERDLSLAKSQNFFPPPTQSLSQIKITIHTKNQKWKESILQSILLPFSKTPDGKYSLQIDAIENFKPPSEALMILQFNLFDNKSQNKIWESSRIYHLTVEDLKGFPNPFPPTSAETK